MVQGRVLAFTPLAHGDGMEAMLSTPIPQEKCRRAPGRQPERVIKLSRMESYSGRLGVCRHMKVIILLQADGELTGNHTVPSAARSSSGQEAKAFIFLGGRGC